MSPLAALVALVLGVPAPAPSSPSAPPPAPPAPSAPASAPAPVAAPAPASAPAPVAAKEISATDAAAWLAAHPDTIVVDVRTPAEYAEGHVAGAVLIDHDGPTFVRDLKALDRERTYVVHCRSGRRSADARDMLVQWGYPHVLHLGGGMQEWTGAGLPVETGPPPAR